MRFFVTIILLLICSTCFPQWDFEWQNPKPQGNTLNKIQFMDLNTGWAVGRAGTIMKTINGGIDWTVQLSERDETFKDIAMSSIDHIWLVGNNGFILKSINSGNTWIDYSINTDQDLVSVYFINNLKGWTTTSTGEIYCTNDGGFTWETQTSGISYPLNDIYFLNDTLGWIAAGGHGYPWNASGYILQTTDGGMQWDLITGDENSYQHITFCDSVHGWIFTAFNGFQKTNDGGKTWQYLDLPMSISITKSAQFVNPDRGFRFDGRLYRSLDGGMSWLPRITIPTIGNDYFFIDDKVGWVAGWGGDIYKTISGGTSVTLQTEGNTFPYFNNLFFIDSLTGWASANDVFYKTNDGGDSWTDSVYEYTYFKDIFFIDKLEGWALVNAGSIMHSTDGGTSWEISGHTYGYSVNTIFFATEKLGFACGDEGVIFKSTDGGYTWIKMDSWVNSDLLDIEFISPEKGWIVGYEGTILYSSDSGDTWSEQIPANLGNLRDVEFVDESNGWVIGSDENFMYTRNGGSTWQFQQIPTNGINHYINITFLDTLHGFLGAQSYNESEPRFTLFETFNGGHSWESTEYRISDYIEEITFTDPNNGWCVGCRGIITHFYHDSTLVNLTPPFNNNLSETIDVKLYPNPCSGHFWIELPSNQTENHILKIYNSTGKLVFMREYHQAKGINRHEIQVQGLKKGMYIVSVQTKSSQVSKKLIIH